MKKREKVVPGPSMSREEMETLIPAARDRLTAATEQLNDLINAAETAILGLHLGVRAEIELDCAHEGYFATLIFGKYGNLWRLLVASGANKSDMEDVQPLRNASRAIRLAGVEALPRLLAALVASSDSELKRVSDAVDSASKFIEQMTKP